MTDKIDWRAYYERVVGVIDFEPENDPTETHRCLAAWAIMPRKRIKSLLDVGCGDGYFCHWIAEKLKIDRVVGLDVSESRLARAHDRYPEIEFVSGCTSKLPFSDGEFEVATCIEVLEHLEDPDAMIREIGRISRCVVITVPDCQVVRTLLCPHCLKVFPASGHLHFFDIDRVTYMANVAGLRLEKVQSYHRSFFEDGSLLIRLAGKALSPLVRRLAKRKGLFLTARMVNEHYA